jgi:ABC-type ATPase with predicted acetyltransferase domain
MLDSDPAADRMNEATNLYECPECSARVEANGSCCCPDCEVIMQNISQPRHQ